MSAIAALFLLSRDLKRARAARGRRHTRRATMGIQGLLPLLKDIQVRCDTDRSMRPT